MVQTPSERRGFATVIGSVAQPRRVAARGTTRPREIDEDEYRSRRDVLRD